jgi:hypothetical protein
MSNKNSRIVTRVTKNGKLRTETSRRDDGADRYSVSTDMHNRTRLFIDLEGGNIRGGETVEMSGHQARTLYRLLARHFDEKEVFLPTGTQKSFSVTLPDFSW